VDRRSRPAHARHDVRAGLDRRRNVRADFDDDAEAFVTCDEELVAGRSRAVLGSVDLLVGSIDADAKHLDENAAAVGDVGTAGLRDLPEVNRAGSPWMTGDCFHAVTTADTCLRYSANSALCSSPWSSRPASWSGRSSCRRPERGCPFHAAHSSTGSLPS